MTHCCQAEPRVCSRLHPMIQTETGNQIHAWTKTMTMEPRLAKHIVGARCQNVIQLIICTSLLCKLPFQHCKHFRCSLPSLIPLSFSLLWWRSFSVLCWRSNLLAVLSRPLTSCILTGASCSSGSFISLAIPLEVLIQLNKALPSPDQCETSLV